MFRCSRVDVLYLGCIEFKEMCCLRRIMVVHVCMCEADGIYVGFQDFDLNFSVKS